MAQVPLSGNINMYDGVTGTSATSIYEVVAHHLQGTPASKEFDSILTHVKNNASIEDFHPEWKPNTLNEIESSSNFRGFPVAVPIVHYCANRVELAL